MDTADTPRAWRCARNIETGQEVHEPGCPHLDRDAMPDIMAAWRAAGSPRKEQNNGRD